MAEESTTARRPLAVAVQQILDIPYALPNGLPGLRDAIAAQTDDEYERARRRLEGELNAPLAAAQISDELCSFVRVISVQRHYRDPDRWPYGKYVQRERLIHEYVVESEDASKPPGKRRLAARAALLLAAQEGFYAGPALVHGVANRKDHDAIAEWPADRWRRLRERLDEDKAQAADLVTSFKSAAWTLQLLMTLPEPELDLDLVNTFIGHLGDVLDKADQRLDFEWRVANQTWMLINLANARQRPDVIDILRAAANGWRRSHAVAQFIAWLDEAFVTPWKAFATPGVVFYSAEQLAKRLIPVQRPF